MTRRNFLRSVKVEIIKRAKRGNQIICEGVGCGIACARFEIHHVVMDAMETDKSKKLTAADGLLLCAGPGSCHERETKAQMPILAKAKAREAAALHVRGNGPKIQSAGFPKFKRERPPSRPVANGLTAIARAYRENVK